MTPDPHDIFANRAWLWCEHPFPHVVARDVFRVDFYRQLSGEFTDLLALGVHEDVTVGRFSRSIAGYDAYGLGFSEPPPGALGFFASTWWHDTICDLFTVRGTGQINYGGHHHAARSRSGFVHNDFNPVWFARKQTSAIEFPDQSRCAYTTGAGPLTAENKVSVVRAVSMIFFLCNDGWRSGDGGELGLYRSPAPPARPYVRVPPRNNSLVAFECTPRSFHRFITNPGRPRNSLILWTHRERNDLPWSDSQLEHWRR
jgi:hypothetical protein